MQRRGCKKAFLLIRFTKELEPHLRECRVLLDESRAGPAPHRGAAINIRFPFGDSDVAATSEDLLNRAVAAI